MAENIAEAMEKLSKKISLFKKSENKTFVPSESKEKKLEKLIKINQAEKIEAIKKEYLNFKNPLSKEIENDREALLKAFEIFKSVSEIKKNTKSNESYLKSFQIDSSVCHKSEYTKEACSKFIFLQCWFYFEKNIKEYLPVIKKDKDSFTSIDFIEKEEVSFSSREKEIWSTVSSLY